MQTNARNQRSATGYILERILEVRVCGVDGLKSLTSQHVFFICLEQGISEHFEMCNIG